MGPGNVQQPQQGETVSPVVEQAQQAQQDSPHSSQMGPQRQQQQQPAQYAFQPSQQPYQPAQQPYQYPPRILPFSKSWHNAKIILRSFDIVFSIIIIALAVYFSTIPIYWAWSAFAFIAFAIPPAGLALIWEVAELITICARGGKLGIHPGAHVGLHLIIWLGAIVALGFGATIVAIRDWDYQPYGYGYGYGSSSSSRSNRISDEAVSSAGDTATAIVAFIALLFIINFILFIRACVETNRRNRVAHSVIIPAGPNGQPMYVMGAPQAPAQVMQQIPQPQPVYYQGGHPTPYQQQPRESVYGSSTAASTPSAPVHDYRGPTQAQTHAQAHELSDKGNYHGADGSYYGPGNSWNNQ